MASPPSQGHQQQGVERQDSAGRRAVAENDQQRIKHQMHDPHVPEPGIAEYQSKGLWIDRTGPLSTEVGGGQHQPCHSTGQGNASENSGPALQLEAGRPGVKRPQPGPEQPAAEQRHAKQQQDCAEVDEAAQDQSFVHGVMASPENGTCPRSCECPPTRHAIPLCTCPAPSADDDLGELVLDAFGEGQAQLFRRGDFAVRSGLLALKVGVGEGGGGSQTGQQGQAGEGVLETLGRHQRDLWFGGSDLQRMDDGVGRSRLAIMDRY
nr:hypothetical protein [Tanacetum cinerariifolium]